MLVLSSMVRVVGLQRKWGIKKLLLIFLNQKTAQVLKQVILFVKAVLAVRNGMECVIPGKRIRTK